MGNLQGPAEMMPIMRGAGCATRSWTKHSPVSHILKESPSRGKEYRYAGVCILILLVRSNLRTLKHIKNATVHLCNILHSNGLGMFGAHLIFLFGTSSHKYLWIQKNSSKILKFYHPCAPHARCGSYKCSYKCCTWYSTSIRAHIYRRT